MHERSPPRWSAMRPCCLLTPGRTGCSAITTNPASPHVWVAPQARVAAMLLLTLRGTPTMYYGDEIGMRDVPISVRQVRDPFEKNVPGLGLGRDPERTPMQWNDSEHAGFTSGTSWLPIG